MNITANETSTPRLNAMFLRLAFFWSVAIVALATWNYWQSYTATVEIARSSASQSYHKDLVYRRWATLHGGVYAPITPETPPNPHLSDIPERDIQTPSGKKLTLINPAYMTRQVHALGKKDFGLIGHITSLKPIRPENAPDAWEKGALQAFEGGKTEVSSLEPLGGETYLRFVRPLITEAGCLKCHATQGYRIGDIRGGISVSLPWAPFREALRSQLLIIIIGYGGIGTIGLLGLYLMRKRLQDHLSERKQAEEEKRGLEERLQRAEKMEALGQLAGGVAHDLNNVLGILSGYSELLLEEIPKGHQSRDHVEKILQSTGKGAAIIEDLLTLARRGVAASEVVNLNGIVAGFLKTPVFEKVKSDHPSITFRTECDKNLLNIKGSPVHLEKSLMNLVLNAVEAISGKGEVTIRTENRYLDKSRRGYEEITEGDYAVLTVSDTGAGIPAGNREKIFEPFYTKKTMGRSGTGLGLTIVWGTVKDHRGYIDVLTEAGEGTTFTLYFPVTQEELIAQQQKASIEQYRGNGESVLVVDDIAEQRDVAARLLTRLGYQVQAVSGGEAAVEYLRRNKADILVLDMIMAPGIDGLETYERVLRINPRQKAIIVSGFSETDHVRKAQMLGAGAYVRKPYMMDAIGAAIRDELRKATTDHARG